jgi:hypothetical protein
VGVARRAGIDTVVNLETFVRYSDLLSWLTGPHARFHRFNQRCVYRRFPHPQVMCNAQIHAGHTFLDLVRAGGAAGGIDRPRPRRATTSESPD